MRKVLDHSLMLFFSMFVVLWKLIGCSVTAEDSLGIPYSALAAKSVYIHNLRTYRNFEILFPSVNFTCNGTISKMSLVLLKGQVPNVHPAVQIWRERHKKVASANATTNYTGDAYNEVNLSLPFQEGDFLGLYQPRGNETVASFVFELNSTNSTVFFSRLNNKRNNNFTRNNRVLINIETDPPNCYDNSFGTETLKRVSLDYRSINESKLTNCSEGCNQTERRYTCRDTFQCNGSITELSFGGMLDFSAGTTNNTVLQIVQSKEVISSLVLRLDRVSRSEKYLNLFHYTPDEPLEFVTGSLLRILSGAPNNSNAVQLQFLNEIYPILSLKTGEPNCVHGLMDSESLEASAAAIRTDIVNGLHLGEQVLLPFINFTSDANVTKLTFGAHFNKSAPKILSCPEFQVWRASGESTVHAHKLVHSTSGVDTCEETLDFSVYEYVMERPWEVEKGDFIGVYVPWDSSLSLSYVSGYAWPLRFGVAGGRSNASDVQFRTLDLHPLLNIEYSHSSGTPPPKAPDATSPTTPSLPPGPTGFRLTVEVIAVLGVVSLLLLVAILVACVCIACVAVRACKAKTYPFSNGRDQSAYSLKEKEAVRYVSNYLAPVDAAPEKQLAAFPNNVNTDAVYEECDDVNLSVESPKELPVYATLMPPRDYSSDDLSQDTSAYWIPASTCHDLNQQLSSWEISRSQLEIGEVIGTGEFGDVRRAVWCSKDGAIQAAVKTLTTGTTELEKVKFLQEAALMCQFHHPNIINLYGVVTATEPALIVSELMNNGDLATFLCGKQSHEGERSSPQLPWLFLDFCCQISCGMHYLSNKGFIHRDLAARNILVRNETICKIADFGMSRDLQDENYYLSQGGKVPVKWTAPEALLYKKYSTASDVWSFGMLMFEVWSVGHKPFEELDNSEVIGVLDKGVRLSPPPGCPRAIYRIMVKCWHPVSSHRPTFQELVRLLSHSEAQLLSWSEEDLKQQCDQVSELGAPLQAGKDLYLDLQRRYSSYPSQSDGAARTSLSSCCEQQC